MRCQRRRQLVGHFGGLGPPRSGLDQGILELIEAVVQIDESGVRIGGRVLVLRVRCGLYKETTPRLRSILELSVDNLGLSGALDLAYEHRTLSIF